MGRSIICASLLKNGYSNFSVQILEYCTSDILLEREQYYFNLLSPSYNIFKVAGSSQGFKHSPLWSRPLTTVTRGLGTETKEKFKILGKSLENLEHLKKVNSQLRNNPEWKAKNLAALKKLHSDPEWLAKRLAALKKLHADPEYQAKRLETLKKLHVKLKGRPRPQGSGSPAIPIEVLSALKIRGSGVYQHSYISGSPVYLTLVSLKKRKFSTITPVSPRVFTLLHPSFITGFADAESSFTITIYPKTEIKTG